MIYLMTPYYHEDFDVILHRVKVLEDYATELMLKGIVVQSPVLVYHPLVLKDRTILQKVDRHFWMEASAAMMKPCQSGHLLMQHGWQESSGVSQELVWAEKLCLPIRQVIIPDEKQYPWYK